MMEPCSFTSIESFYSCNACLQCVYTSFHYLIIKLIRLSTNKFFLTCFAWDLRFKTFQRCNQQDIIFLLGIQNVRTCDTTRNLISICLFLSRAGWRTGGCLKLLFRDEERLTIDIFIWLLLERVKVSAHVLKLRVSYFPVKLIKNIFV